MSDSDDSSNPYEDRNYDGDYSEKDAKTKQLDKIHRKVEIKSQHLLSSIPGQYKPSGISSLKVNDAASDILSQGQDNKSRSNQSSVLPLILDAQKGFPSKRTMALSSL